MQRETCGGCRQWVLGCCWNCPLNNLFHLFQCINVMEDSVPICLFKPSRVLWGTYYVCTKILWPEALTLLFKHEFCMPLHVLCASHSLLSTSARRQSSLVSAKTKPVKHACACARIRVRRTLIPQIPDSTRIRVRSRTNQIARFKLLSSKHSMYQNLVARSSHPPFQKVMPLLHVHHIPY